MPLGAPLLSFNSYMVRFKVLDVLFLFFLFFVSIPIWFDLKNRHFYAFGVTLT